MTAVAAEPPRRAVPWGLLLLLGAALALWRISDLILVGFIAALFAVYLGGLTDLWCRRWVRMPRLAGLVVSLVLTLLALAGILMLLAPAVLQQTGDLLDSLPIYLNGLDRFVRRIAEGSDVLRRTGIAGAEEGLVTTALAAAVDFARRSFFAYAAGTGRLLIDAFAVVAMALYLSWKPTMYTEGIVRLVPPRRRAVARAVFADLGSTLRAWVGAQLIAMVVLATATGIGLWLLDVPYWLAFSIFTGVAVMVPFFGTITSTLLPALLVLPDRGAIAFFAVVAVGLVVHLVEANIVHPLIMHERVSLPPALTIISVLAMGALAGLLGMLVAVPALASIFVLVRHLLLYEHYGERPAAVTGDG